MIRNRQLSRPLLALALCLAAAPPVAGALFIVDTTTLDAGDLVPGDGKCEWATIVPAGQRCTLRAAVQEANVLAGADVIIIPDGWHVVLSRSGSDDGSPDAGIGDLDILESVAIGGFLPPGPDLWPIIDGAGSAQVVFEVHAPATLTLSKAQVTNNDAIPAGAGAIINSGAGGEFRDCRFHGNNGNGGAIFNRGTTTITRCTVENNSFSSGAALENRGTLTVRDSLVASNNFPYAIWNRDNALLRLFNTTVVGNSGDGIYSTDDLVLENVTITDNAIKGLRHSQPLAFASPRIVNSILAHNGGDCFITIPGGAPDTAHPNLDTDGSCGFLPAFGGLPGTDPLLAPIQSAGGATPVFVPRVGSPVVDAGDNGNCTANDQRGAPRPLDGGGAAGADCDLGAVEVLPCDTEPPSGTFSNLVVSPPGAVGIACFTIDVGPAVDVLNGALLGLAARDRVTFRNGFAVQSGGELEVILHHGVGSSVTVP